MDGGGKLGGCSSSLSCLLFLELWNYLILERMIRLRWSPWSFIRPALQFASFWANKIYWSGVVVSFMNIVFGIESRLAGVGEVTIETESVAIVALKHCTDEPSFHGVKEVHMLLLRPWLTLWVAWHVRLHAHRLQNQLNLKPKIHTPFFFFPSWIPEKPKKKSWRY